MFICRIFCSIAHINNSNYMVLDRRKHKSMDIDSFALFVTSILKTNQGCPS